MEAPPVRPVPVPPSGRSRAMLTWFGVDSADALASPEVAQPAPVPTGRTGRLVRALLAATFFALLGAAVGVASAETHFGLLGGIAAGARLTGLVAREIRMPRLGSVLGMVGFFAAMVLVFSALLVGTIAALPMALEKLLG